MKFMDTARALACEEAELLLSRGLDGDLSGAEAGLMYAHIAVCDMCRRAMGEMAALEFALRELGGDCGTAVLDDEFSAELADKLAAGSGDGGVAQLRQFGRYAARDAVLCDKLQSAGDNSGFVRLCVQLGRENGYTFSTEQVESLLGIEASNDNELNDSQLDRVVAGSAGFDALKLLGLLTGLD